VFFPTAFFLSTEEFGVEVEVRRIMPVGPRGVNLFPDPSLACYDRRVAVAAGLYVIGDHYLLLILAETCATSPFL
jgi:hypothetical protein